MSEELKQIAARIRELREVAGYTVEEMAKDLGVSLEQYLEYEEQGENIPISVMYHLSQKFGTDMSEIITGKSARLDTYEICRRGKGKRVDRSSGYMYEDLAAMFARRMVQPLLVTINPGDPHAALTTHKGQEFNLVLEGTVIVNYDGVEHALNEGDSIYLNPERPHGHRAIGNKKARFLAVIIE